MGGALIESSKKKVFSFFDGGCFGVFSNRKVESLLVFFFRFATEISQTKDELEQSGGHSRVFHAQITSSFYFVSEYTHSQKNFYLKENGMTQRDLVFCFEQHTYILLLFFF